MAINELSRQVAGVAALINTDLLHHLTDDQLDVLVVDVHSLRAEHLLDLVDEVLLGSRATAQCEQVVRVKRALVELSSAFDLVAVLDEQTRALRERIIVFLAAVVGNRDNAVLLRVLGRYGSRFLRHLGETLRLTGLKQLDYARQTVRDVGSSNAAGVEGTHRQLGARLADRLGGNDADCVADLGKLAGGKCAAVTGLADADF
uniref:Unannotated protein n=1 Tax=freshwater metagenome TaxID=449393 RepID=A0A6J5ZQ54_9ZZZZ